MPNGFRNGRQTPHPVDDEGKGWRIQLKSRSQAILNSLMALLPSNYLSQIPSSNYATHLKSFATELARVTLTLEDLTSDISFEDVRSEFLQQVVGYLVFTDGTPDVDMDDEEFRDFLLTIIGIYFQGSTPQSLEEAVELFLDGDVSIVEKGEDTGSGSPWDISDQHAFSVEFEDGSFPDGLFDLQSNLRIILDIVRPAHTIFSLNWIFTEDADVRGSAEDDVTWHMADYEYDDIRMNWDGLWGFESSTGEIDASDLTTLTDSDADQPIFAVSEGVQLRVLSGPNEGIYRVVDTDSNALGVHPSFNEAESGVSYHVRIDRLGVKREKAVSEDVSEQIVEESRLTVDAGGPYTGQFGNTISLSATSSRPDATFEWDINGDNVYDDKIGSDPDVSFAQSEWSAGDIRVLVSTNAGDVVDLVYGVDGDGVTDFETASFVLSGASDLTHTLSSTPEPGTERVHLNGLLLTPTDDYTLSGADVVIDGSVGAAAGDELEVAWSTSTNGETREVFQPSSSTSTHTLSATPVETRVWFNGVLLEEGPSADYVVSGDQIQHNVYTPTSGDDVVVVYATDTPTFAHETFEVTYDGEDVFDPSEIPDPPQQVVYRNGLALSSDEWETAADRSVWVWVLATDSDGRRARDLAEIQLTD